MKRILTVSLAAALSLGLLAGCGSSAGDGASDNEPAPIVGETEHLHLLLPSTAGAAVVAQRGDAFCAALQQEMADRGWTVDEVTVSVAATEASSGKALDDGTADVVVFPASQYFTYSDDTDLLMTATRPGLSVNTTDAADWNGSVDAVTYTDEDCPYSRTLICSTVSDKGRALAQKAKDGTLTWEDLESAKWMYAKATSSSDFFYPDLWLTQQFGKTLEDLPNLMAIDGYGALMAEASRGEADVVVLAADLRVDYNTAWQLESDDMDYTGKMGLSRADSIFNELQVLGVTEPIYGDVLAVRTDEEPFADADFQTALIGAMDGLKNNEDARAIWQTCGYTGFVASGDSRYDNIRELTVFGVGD